MARFEDSFYNSFYWWISKYIDLLLKTKYIFNIKEIWSEVILKFPFFDIFYHTNVYFFAHVACPMVPKFYSFVIVNLRQSFYQCHAFAVAILQHCNFYNPRKERKRIRFLKQIYLLPSKELFSQTFCLSRISLEAISSLNFLGFK